MKKPIDAAKRKLPMKAVSQPVKVTLQKIPTGVRGLDDILGGGIPEFSFNIIAGSPGSGKTTMVHQIVFANATAKNPALFFTILGEPAIKMLEESPFYSDRERAALAWCETVTCITEGHVPDEVYEKARTQFSEKELVNLTLAIVA